MADCVYPFTALVGQEQLKLALMIAAIAPQSGVLVTGQKGTAKSTAARGLARLLPKIRRVAGCPFACAFPGDFSDCPHCRKNGIAATIETPAPFVELPLNATEDRLIGSVDVGEAIRSGRRTLQPGLLATAHRGFLYIDEVNLLDDHLAQAILDAAASGWNTVEREGIRAHHPAAFALVGTMNPEEGELRPQLKDRFAMCVTVNGEENLDRRVELMARRERFDAEPEAFAERFAVEQQALAERLARAKRLYPAVTIAGHLRANIARICQEANAAGLRAELALESCSRAHAALRGASSVGIKDVLAVTEMVLAHRRRAALPPSAPDPEPDPREHDTDDTPDNARNKHDRGEESREKHQPEKEELEDTAGEGETKETPPASSGNNALPESSEDSPEGTQDQGEDADHYHDIGLTFRVKNFVSPKDARHRSGSGRRSGTRTGCRQGRYVKYIECREPGRCKDIAIDATLRAAAPFQRERKRMALEPVLNAPAAVASKALIIKPADLREKVREKKTGNALLFLVDASGSMGARGRMEASKGAIMSLLLDAYQKRDRTGLVAFRRDSAEELLPFTSSIELAGKLLKEMPIGGKTPLAAGLEKTYLVLRRQLHRDPDCRPIAFILTDGKANAALAGGNPLREALALADKLALDRRVKYVVLDTEPAGPVRLGLAGELATRLGADYFTVEDLKADSLLDVVRKNV